MSSQTEKLGLFKYDPEVDKNKTFNITKALNENWDKIDDFARDLKVGFYPLLVVTVKDGSTVTCTDGKTTLTATAQEGGCVFEVPSYGTWTLSAKLGGQTSNEVQVLVDTVKKYPVTLSYFAATLTVTAADGAEVKATNGSRTYTGTCSGSSQCQLAVDAAGTYAVTATKDGCGSSTATVQVTTEGQIYKATVTFITLTVSVDAGSSVTVQKGNVTKQALCAAGAVTFYLPSTGTWSVTATLSGQSATGTANCSTHSNYSIKLDYFKYYGVKIQISNSNPETAVTYVEDATGMTPGYEGWKNAPIFKDIKPCLVKDGVFQCYLNKNNLAQKEDGSPADITSGNAGDVMVEIPKIGYKITTDGSYHYIHVTNNPRAPGYCYRAHSMDTEGDCDKIYIGAFLASGIRPSSGLFSLSGVIPTSAHTLSNFSYHASEFRGPGYEILSFYPLTLLQCLYLIMYKNLNSQEAIGRGFSDGNGGARATGGTVTKGPCYGEQTGKEQMCFLNIEDLWGNLRQWIAGLYSDENGNIKTAFKQFNANGQGYPFSKQTGAVTNGWINNIQGTNECGFLIKTGSGSSSTYYADSGEIKNNSLCIFGGAYEIENNSGIFHCYVSMTDDFSNTSTGARLVYKHKEASV